MNHDLQCAINALRNAQSVAVLTGAGISAESGVPTFRDALTGLWAKFDPTELATPEAFLRDPELVQRWYAMRREMCATVEPNAGHLALAKLETRVSDFMLTTQNVDGLHRRAGSQNVLELHGNITRFKCFDTGAAWQGDLPTDPPAKHPDTGGLLRPDVVWFGEGLPAHELAEAERTATRANVYLSIGTSSVVYPAAGLPALALRSGATVIEINPDETPFSSDATISIRANAGDVLPKLVEALGE